MDQPQGPVDEKLFRAFWPFKDTWKDGAMHPRDSQATKTVSQFVSSASSKTYKSQWLATSQSLLFCICYAARFPVCVTGQERRMRSIAVIIRDKIEGRIVDLTKDTVRDECKLGSSAKNFAMSASEVLVEGVIDGNAILDIFKLSSNKESDYMTSVLLELGQQESAKGNDLGYRAFRDRFVLRFKTGGSNWKNSFAPFAKWLIQQTHYSTTLDEVATWFMPNPKDEPPLRKMFEELAQSTPSQAPSWSPPSAAKEMLRLESSPRNVEFSIGATPASKKTSAPQLEGPSHSFRMGGSWREISKLVATTPPPLLKSPSRSSEFEERSSTDTPDNRRKARSPMPRLCKVKEQVEIRATGRKCTDDESAKAVPKPRDFSKVFIGLPREEQDRRKYIKLTKASYARWEIHVGKVGIQLSVGHGGHMAVELKNGEKIKWRGKDNVELIDDEVFEAAEA